MAFGWPRGSLTRYSTFHCLLCGIGSYTKALNNTFIIHRACQGYWDAGDAGAADVCLKFP